MNDLQKYLSTCLLATAALFVDASPAWAQTAPALGTASNFAALGGAGVTCTSPNPPLPAVTISGGNVGSLLLANSSVTGFPGFTPGALPCSLSGTVQLGATGAFADFLTAYNTLAGITCPTDPAHNLVGDLGGKVLSPGVYCIGGVGLLTSKLTLAGPSTAIWIFKATSFTPIAGSVVMANGGNACNVYWQLGTTASFVNTQFAGNILAGTAITFSGTGSSLVGRALAKTDVTMTSANISLGNCGTAGPPSCKGKECDRDDGDKDKDKKDREKDKDKEHGSDHSPFGSNDDHDDKSGRKDGDK